jgi:hypothetical protein
MPAAILEKELEQFIEDTDPALENERQAMQQAAAQLQMALCFKVDGCVITKAEKEFSSQLQNVEVGGMKWTFDHYVMVRWSFVESWKTAVAENPHNPRHIEPDEARNFLKKSEAGKNWSLPPEQSTAYFLKVQNSLVQCGMINTPVIRTKAAEENQVKEGFAIWIKPGTLMQRPTANNNQQAQQAAAAAAAQQAQAQAQAQARQLQIAQQQQRAVAQARQQQQQQQQMTPLQKQQMYHYQLQQQIQQMSPDLIFQQIQQLLPRHSSLNNRSSSFSTCLMPDCSKSIPRCSHSSLRS